MSNNSDMAEPTAVSPGIFRDTLVHMIYVHYIGQSASKIKAEKLADKIIEGFTAFYEAQLEAENGAG